MPDPHLLCDLHAGALAWVNRVRRLLGVRPLAQLPRGLPGDEHLHPLTLAMPQAARLHADGRLDLLAAQLTLEPDPFTRQFIISFDEYLYPDLIDVDGACELLLADLALEQDGRPEEELAEDLWTEFGFDDPAGGV